MKLIDMKRIDIYECISADSEWTRYRCRVNPHSSDVDMDSEASARYVYWGLKELNSIVADLPLDSAKWKRQEISNYLTVGGIRRRRTWRTRVLLTLEDQGRCILGRISMNGVLKSLLVLFPENRRHIADECILLRIALSLPEHVRDKVAAKIKADGLTARVTVAFLMWPRKLIKAEPPGIDDYERLLMRAGLRWAERRDFSNGSLRRADVFKIQPRKEIVTQKQPKQTKNVLDTKIVSEAFAQMRINGILANDDAKWDKKCANTGLMIRVDQYGKGGDKVPFGVVSCDDPEKGRRNKRRDFLLRYDTVMNEKFDVIQPREKVGETICECLTQAGVPYLMTADSKIVILQGKSRRVT